MTDIPTKSGLSKNLKDLLINPRSFNISLNIPLRDAAIVRKSNATATGGTIQGMSRMLAIILLILVSLLSKIAAIRPIKAAPKVQVVVKMTVFFNAFQKYLSLNNSLSMKKYVKLKKQNTCFYSHY